MASIGDPNAISSISDEEIHGAPLSNDEATKTWIILGVQLRQYVFVHGGLLEEGSLLARLHRPADSRLSVLDDAPAVDAGNAFGAMDWAGNSAC